MTESSRKTSEDRRETLSKLITSQLSQGGSAGPRKYATLQPPDNLEGR